jgi:hypothetical protein
MAVTRSTATVPNAVIPALEAPVGGARLTESVSPVGIAVGMLAEIFAPVWFVVIAHVLVPSVTAVGWLPAVAVVTVSEGEPVALI